MRLIDSHRLSGPNIYTSRPVVVARLELDGLTGQETSDCPGFAAPADQRAARAGRAPLRRGASRRLPRRAGPRDLLRSRDRACGARAVRPGRPRGGFRADGLGRRRGPLRRDHGMPPGRAGLLRRATGPAHAGHPGGHRDPGRAPGAAAGRPRADRPGTGRGPAGGQHRRPGRGGPPARHPGPADREPEPDPPRLRLPPPAALGGPHRADLRRGRGHRLGQGAGQGTAGHRGSTGARRGGRPVGGRRRGGPGHAAGAAGDQAPQRQPRGERHGGGDVPGPGRRGVPAGQHQRRRGRRRGIRPWRRLPGPGRGRARGGGGPAASGRR